MRGSAFVAANLALGLVVVGCGNVAVEENPDGNPGNPGVNDAAESPDSGDVPGADAAVSRDGSVAGCAADAPITRFGPAPGLNGRSSQCCAFLPDPLTAFFSAGDGFHAETADLFRATRSSTSEPFGARELIVGADTEDGFWSPTLSSDGLSLYYSRMPAGRPTQGKVQRSVRAAIDDAFGSGKELQLGSGVDIREADSAISDDGLFFIRQNRILFAPANGEVFAPGAPVVEIAPVVAGNRDTLPAVTADRKVLYWGTDRSGPGVAGDFDIWVAELESDDQYSAPRVVPGINSSAFEAPSWISADGCEIYFTTRRNGRNEIWVGQREPQ